MTTTMIRSHETTRTTSGVDSLRVLMNDALSVASDDDAGSFDSRTATGHALLSLAALARQAAGALGAEPGIPVASGPGVLVVRELVAAVRLLDEAASLHAESTDVDGFLATAKGLHAQLHDALARTGR